MSVGSPAEFVLKTTSIDANKAKISKDNSGESELKIESSLGSSACPITFYNSNAGESMRINSLGQVGIGTDSLEAKLHVNGNILAETDTITNITLRANVDNGNDSTFQFHKTRNGGNVLAGDDLGTIAWSGYDSGTYQVGASIRSEASFSTGSFGGTLLYDADVHYLRTSNVSRLTIQQDGKVNISSGILFGTDTAANNTLDDYEEGTWTPVIQNGTFTYSKQIGNYTKVGNIVNAVFLVRWTAASGTGIFNVSLPFTSKGNTSNDRYSASIGYHVGMVRADAVNLVAANNGSLSYLTIHGAAADGTIATYGVQNLQASGEIQVAITYHAA